MASEAKKILKKADWVSNDPTNTVWIKGILRHKCSMKGGRNIIEVRNRKRSYIPIIVLPGTANVPAGKYIAVGGILQQDRDKICVSTCFIQKDIEVEDMQCENAVYLEGYIKEKIFFKKTKQKTYITSFIMKLLNGCSVQVWAHGVMAQNIQKIKVKSKISIYGIFQSRKIYSKKKVVYEVIIKEIISPS